ncbi:MAG: hypothetical protein ACREX4_04315 [Gammaproteobacteria bacterium]
MSYLHGWQRILRHPTSNDGRVVVFDHGPIFRLVQLREFGPESTKSHRYGRWWSSMLKRWAHTLNIIVWLDTREPVLLERLQTRTKGHHRIKRLSEDESYEFLARYRSAYKGIITKLTGDGCQTLLYFDTSKHSTEQIADKVLAACNLVGREI